MAYLQVNNICKKVSELEILSNISLSFDNKGLVFIVGKSGAGKSSLLNIIGQLDKEYDGEVILDNQVCKKNENTFCELRRNKIGYVFQEFNLLGELTVSDNMSLANKLSNDNNISVNKLLKLFCVEECANKKCKVLSGGERQRVAIARIVYKGSDVILADEPTGNLDGVNTQQVFDVLKSISKDRLVIVVSHDLDAAKKYADRIITISDGRIVSDEENIATASTVLIDDINITTKEKTSKSNPFSRIIKENLKNGIRRNVMIVAMCMMMLLLTTVVTSMINAMNNVNNSINVILENDILKVYNPSDDNELKNKEISAEFIDDISAIGCESVVGYHNMSIGIYKDNDYISVDYKVYKDDEYFSKRMEYNGLSIPEKETDIIINEVLAKHLFGTKDCIGNSFNLTGFNYDVQCTVYAVTNVLNVREPEIYITNGLLDVLFATIKDSDSALHIWSPSKMNSCFLNVQLFENEQQILYGRKPNSRNEIVINAGGFNEILSVLELKYSNVSIEDFINGKISDEMLYDVLNSKITINVKGDDTMYEDLSIVGINTNVDDYLIVYMESSEYEEFQTSSIDMIDIYLANREENLEKVNQIVDKYGYELEDNGGVKAMIIASRLSLPVMLISALAMLVFIIVFMFIRFATKINIMNQTKEIGILKALGASNTQVKNIYIKENIVLFLLSMVSASFVIIALQVLSAKGMLTYKSIKVFDVNVGYYFFVCLFGVLTAYIASVLEVRKIAKMNLIDILHKNN